MERRLGRLAAGGVFGNVLSEPLEFGKAERPLMRGLRQRRLTVPVSPSVVVGRLRSPLSGASALLWGRCRPRASDIGLSLVPPHDPEPFRRRLIGWEFSRVGWNGVGHSPVSVGAVVSRRDRAPPRRSSELTATCSRRTKREGLGRCFSRLRSMAQRLGQSGPSRIDLAWPLRQRPLLSAAGCVGLSTSSKVF